MNDQAVMSEEGLPIKAANALKLGLAWQAVVDALPAGWVGPSIDLHDGVPSLGELERAPELAFRDTAGLDPAERHEALTELMAEHVSQARRAAARAVERRAMYDPDERREQRDRRKAHAEKRAEWERINGREYDPLGQLFSDIKAFADAVRLEVTVELLASRFALGDGTSVTWGEATAAQHEERIALLERQVLGNVETIALHRQAIALLTEQGAICLGATSAVAA